MIKKSNAIVFVFDDRFFDQFKACINSLKANYPEHPNLLAHYRGEDPRVKEFLDLHGVQRMNLEYASLTSTVNPGPINNSIVFNRFSLWTSAFENYETVLYLDSDTLVLGSLSDLFSTQEFFIVSNHEPSPVARIFRPEYQGVPALSRLLQEDGLRYPDHPDDMANAGVFSIPRSRRNAGELEYIQSLGNRYGPYLAYADQSLISLWCKLRGIEYSRKYEYNYQSPFVTQSELADKFDDARILHFSNHKPGSEKFEAWNRIQGWQDRLRSLYCHYRDL